MKDKIEDFLKKYKISGLFYIPGRGTFAIWENDKDKLLVLEHASIELGARKKIIEKEINKIVSDLSTDNDTIRQRYVG
jgi:hypothetical protein